MNAGSIRRRAASAMFVGLLAGCGGAASPSPASQGASAPSQGAPSVAAPSIAASVTPSQAAPSTEPSLAIPSFSLPSEAKDLEALLPGKMCGATSTKASQSGQSFAGNEDFDKVLSSLGKSPSDVSYAIAIGADSGCVAGIFRIQGTDTGALQGAFAASAQQSGDTFTDKNVGGKDVKVQTGSDSPSFFYFRGDAVLFVTAKSEAEAATILQQMP